MRLKINAPPWARQMISDLTDMDRDPLELNGAESLPELELPDDVYFQYGFVTDDGKVEPDPRRAEKATNIWYGEVSEVRGPNYRPDELADVAAEVATGSHERLRVTSEILNGATRRATLYTPAGHAQAELPLVVVQDGVTFMRVGRLAAVLEALLERSEVRPARLLMVEPLDRLAEYAYDDDYASFVLDELIPSVAEAHPTARNRVWLGASLGGQASAYLFARGLETGQATRDDAVVALSGAFLGAPGDADHYRSRRSWLLEWLVEQEAVSGRWHLDVGSLEWLHEVNVQVADALAKTGAESQLSVRSAGHNWVAWRDALPDALRFALG